jgi:hypothetical protein
LDPFTNDEGLQFAGAGVAQTHTNSSTTNCDHKMPGDRYFNGIEIMLKDQNWADTANMQVVDVDDIMGYGAGTVLSTFAANWRFDDTVCNQGVFLLNYKATILKDLYLRIAYTSAGGTDVKANYNFFLHEIKP